MCFVKASSAEPEQIQKPAEIVDPNVQKASTDAQKKARAASGAQSTILSKLMAPLQAPTGGAGKTLTGQ